MWQKILAGNAIWFQFILKPRCCWVTIKKLTSPWIPKCFEIDPNAEASQRGGERGHGSSRPTSGEKNQPKDCRLGLSFPPAVLDKKNIVLYSLFFYIVVNMKIGGNFYKLLFKNWKIKQHWTSSQGLKLSSLCSLWMNCVTGQVAPTSTPYCLFCHIPLTQACHLLDFWKHQRLHFPWLGGSEARLWVKASSGGTEKY